MIELNIQFFGGRGGGGSGGSRGGRGATPEKTQVASETVLTNKDLRGKVNHYSEATVREGEKMDSYFQKPGDRVKVEKTFKDGSTEVDDYILERVEYGTYTNTGETYARKFFKGREFDLSAANFMLELSWGRSKVKTVKVTYYK